MEKFLDSDSIPDPGPDCERCMYRKLIWAQE